MTDYTLILEAMQLIIDDTHPTLYIYIKGHNRSKENAISRVTEEVHGLFKGVFDIAVIRKLARIYLQDKEVEYNKGQLKVRSIY